MKNKLYYSKNFKLKDAFHSQIAIENNIDNTTENKEIINNILYSLDMFKSVYKAIKKRYKRIKREDIEITSFYRCDILNRHKRIDGTSTSDHLFGRAIDFKVKGLTPKQVCEAIYKDYLMFDQLIQEPTWVHISFESIDFYNKKHYLIKTEKGYKRIDSYKIV